MLSKEEEDFLVYWEKNRERERKFLRQLYVGLPLGILTGIAILFCLSSGWYKRAVMVANSQLNFNVLIAGIAAVAVFIAIFYKRHKWEMKEQRYNELLIRKKKNEREKATSNMMF